MPASIGNFYDLLGLPFETRRYRTLRPVGTAPFTHGAAGRAYAVLNLFRETGEGVWLEGALPSRKTLRNWLFHLVALVGRSVEAKHVVQSHSGR